MTVHGGNKACLTLSAPHESAWRAAWQNVIDKNLIEWRLHPSMCEDDGIDPPSGTTIALAIKLAECFRDEAIPPPYSVLTDPNGGIVFERRWNGGSEVYYVWEDGTVEYQRYAGHRLEERFIL